jgi:hypothetical protein
MSAFDPRDVDIQTAIDMMRQNDKSDEEVIETLMSELDLSERDAVAAEIINRHPEVWTFEQFLKELEGIKGWISRTPRHPFSWWMSVEDYAKTEGNKHYNRFKEAEGK